MIVDFRVATESDRTRLLDYIAEMPLDKPVKVSVKPADRSSEQNRALHAALSDISRQVEHYGKKFDVETWKRLCTAAWLREEGEQAQLIPAIDGQGFDLIFARTSKLTVKQCASLLEWVSAFGSQAGVKWTQKDLWDNRY